MRKIIFTLFVVLTGFSGYSQLSEDFESNGTALPTGWQKINVSGTGKQWTVAAQSIITPAFGGTGHAAYIDRENVPIGTAEDWLVTPQFTVPQNGELYFQSRLTQLGDDNNTYRIMIHTGSTPLNTSSYTELQAWTELTLNPDPDQTNYIEKHVTLPAGLVGTSVYIAFVMNGDNGDRWLIDDVSVHTKCIAEHPSVTNLTPTSARLTWDNTGATSFYVEVQITADSGPPTIIDSTTVTTNYYDISSLLENTRYLFLVKANCPFISGEHSEEVSETFRTSRYGDNCSFPITVSSLPYIGYNNQLLREQDEITTPGTGCTTGTTGYDHWEYVVYSYTPPPSVTEIDIEVNPLHNATGIFVFTDCEDIGTNCLAGTFDQAQLQKTINDLDVTPGTEYFIVVAGAYSFDSFTGYTIAITEEACTNNIEAVFNVDCNDALNFDVVADITDLGSATSLEATIYRYNTGVLQPLSTQTISTPGVYNFGTFGSTDTGYVVLTSQQDPDCFIVSSFFTKYSCPPVNDDCANAKTVGNETKTSCVPLRGTLSNATPSLEVNSCPGSANDDVWYKFVANGTKQIIKILPVDDNLTDFNHSLYRGGICDNLTLVYCSEENESTATNLIPGQTYTIRVYSATSSPVNTKFDICTLSLEDVCPENPAQAELAKGLFIQLLNHLLAVEVPTTGPYDCNELAPLIPYILDPNPLIYNFVKDAESGTISFSFADHNEADGPDVILKYPTGGFVDTIDFFNFESFSDEANMYVTFGNGEITSDNTVKHIDFCPDFVCQPVVGNIRVESGLACTTPDEPTIFTVVTTNTNIEQYSWVFYRSGNVVYTSIVEHPVIDFKNDEKSSDWKAVLVVTTADGCTTTIEKPFIVNTACTQCTEENLQSPVVKELYLNLINYLISTYCGNGSVAITTPFNCSQLVALAPYITDTTPLIYNLTFNGTKLEFSFSDSVSPDISIDNEGAPGIITDIDLLSFTSPEIQTSIDTKPLIGGIYHHHTVSHVDFCPGECPPLTGKIKLVGGITCIKMGTPKEFYFDAGGFTITGYDWTFFRQEDMVEVFSSDLQRPVFTFEKAPYIVKLVVTYGDGCNATFYKMIVVDTGCEEICAENNPGSPEVREYYMDLINYLLTLQGNVFSNQFTCSQLESLRPYITDDNAKIWNLAFEEGIMKFSFSNHGATYDVSVPTEYGQVTDINLMTYAPPSTTEEYQTIDTMFDSYINDNHTYYHTVRHINFCPEEECEPILGSIALDSGVSCVAPNVNVGFHLQPGIPAGATVLWTFYNQFGNGSTTSTEVNPHKIYAQPGHYKIKLVVKDGTSCKTTFHMTISVSTSCSVCTESNQDSQEVIALYMRLLNKLLSMGSTLTDGYTCPELTDLAPYISDSNPVISNPVWSNGKLSFGFSSGHSDVIVDNFGTIAHVNTVGYEGAENESVFIITYADGTQSFVNTTKHIDFCPEIEHCQSHIAFVLDESASIDAVEALKIKKQLKNFLELQNRYGSGTVVSFIGMCDSDTYTRTDEVSGRLSGPVNNPAGKFAELNDWLDHKYKSPYTAARRAMGISPNSDYWASGISKALSYDLKPEIIILITDGSQTADMERLKNLIHDADVYSHLYVYGIGSGYYVDGINPVIDTNDPENQQNEVTGRLMTSLKFLLNLPSTQFPVSNKNDLMTSNYFEYPTFDHLVLDLDYFYNKLAEADLGCGPEPLPKDFCENCETFQPMPDETYWVSGWVKEEHNIQVKNYEHVVLKLVFDDDNEDQVSEISFNPAGEIIDGWQRIAAKFVVPHEAAIMRIELINLNDGIPAYFDDIRIHPIHGSMKSFVYDPETFRLMAEHDDNNYTTFYEYDKEGGLVRIKKETSKGVKTIQESRSGNVIKTVGENED
ncbi:choice-of-anchor J domain-containing protein [Flavobacterium sp. DGU11]|uniref:Choice-of-anchor J domain-containing protein n=1 Tax=Flavobacterium arundinis TaxID=3139143 RepID=A0ABU9HYD4_9FLAO